MGEDIRWERLGVESRLESMADHVPEFVDAELATIDLPAARADPRRWAAVSRFFAGCAAAARAQDPMRRGAGARVAAYFSSRFPGDAEPHAADEGFDEFMDWLSRPDQFRPTRLRAMVERA